MRNAGEHLLALVNDLLGLGSAAQGQLKRLFQPFERQGAERTWVQGTGLGMVIARSLVIEMGASLVVRSMPRQGTTATLELAAA